MDRSTIPFDPDLVRRAARRLTAGVNAPNAELADARIYRMIRWGAHSPRNTGVFFAAVQMLRDLGAIDRPEAAYLFNGLWEHLLWSEIGSDDSGDPDLGRAILDGVDDDLVLVAMGDQERVRLMAWYRDRGEEELAEMVSKRLDEYDQLCADGQISLLDEKPASEQPGPQIQHATAAARVAECALALSATETMREWCHAWQALCDEMRGTHPATAVPTIRNLRDVACISFEESLVLIDMAIEDEVSAVLAADRQYYRLQRDLDEVERSHGISQGDGAPDETRPLAWQILHQRLNRRIDGQTAVVLRQFGEHRLANLLLANPAEYVRIRDEVRIGGG